MFVNTDTRSAVCVSAAGGKSVVSLIEQRKITVIIYLKFYTLSSITIKNIQSQQVLSAIVGYGQQQTIYQYQIINK